MKVKYYLLALAGLMMASCSEDNDPLGPNGGQGQSGQRELSFVFPGTAQGVVPYAVTASEDENELKTLDIYVFGIDSMSNATPQPMVLEEIFRSGQGYNLTTTGTDKQAKISVPAGNNKAFYFVANGREHLSLDSVELHVTDTATFKKKMSNTLKGHIICPMLMSAQVDMPDVTATLTAANTAGTGVKVELTRRVARFDIKNNSETSSFVIDKVVLSDVPANAPLFPIDSYVAPRVNKMSPIDFSVLANSNAGVTNSVFYLYPVKKTDNVGFSLVGTNLVTHAPQVLDVEFKEYKTKNPVEVKANNRYLVEVEDLGSGELEATLRVIEWIVGDTVNVNTGDGTIKLSSTNTGFANNTLSVTAEPTLVDSVTIAVAADGEWELIVEDQYKDWIGVSTLPGDTVLKTFKVTTLLPNPSSKEARQGVVMVQNVRRPSIRQPLIVKQAAQDPATGRFLDISGIAVAGNLLSLSGEKTDSDSLNITISAPAGTSWKATKPTSASWFTFGDKAQLKSVAEGGATFEGTGQETFSIVPTPNTDKNTPRVDTVLITITKAGDQKTDLIQKLIIHQAPQNLGSITAKCIGLSGGKVSLQAGGFTDKGTSDGQHVGERKVTVNATTQWKVVIPVDATWLTQEGAIELVSPSQNGSFYLKASPNTAADAVVRSAIVRIENTQDPTIYQAIEFTQAADPIVVLPEIPVLSSQALTVDNTGATLSASTITINSGVGDVADWEIENDATATWVSATLDDATTITVTMANDGTEDNSTGTERVATIKLKNKAHPTVYVEFTVTQAGV